MSPSLAVGAVFAWAIGAVTMPIVAWFWLRAGRRRWVLIGFLGGFVAEVAWLVPVVTEGLDVVLAPERDVGMTGWAAWAVGVGGLAALVSGLQPDRKPERSGSSVVDPDRAAEIGIGLFGLGVLLRQLALTL